ncbi:MAG TPA: QsdR family transcriptional regulator [Kofleriaceae bacterium]
MQKRVTPLDAFKLARKRWLQGERIDVGKIASELGVGRATVFRWVGTRENLYGEICSALFQKQLELAQAGARGSGLDQLIDVMERLLRSLASAAPLRRFVAEDPEFALRVLTSRHSPVQRRCTVAITQLIDELAEAGDMNPALPSDELAYIVVRITESFLYRDVITGGEADIEAAIAAIRILLAAAPDPQRPRKRQRVRH